VGRFLKLSPAKDSYDDFVHYAVARVIPARVSGVREESRIVALRAQEARREWLGAQVASGAVTSWREHGPSRIFLLPDQFQIRTVATELFNELAKSFSFGFLFSSQLFNFASLLSKLAPLPPNLVPRTTLSNFDVLQLIAN
jgi:hypothetical protein